MTTHSFFHAGGANPFKENAVQRRFGTVKADQFDVVGDQRLQQVL
jgi:hypothetical protein